MTVRERIYAIRLFEREENSRAAAEAFSRLGVQIAMSAVIAGAKANSGRTAEEENKDS